jgi:hypothetical protein
MSTCFLAGFFIRFISVTMCYSQNIHRLGLGVWESYRKSTSEGYRLSHRTCVYLPTFYVFKASVFSNTWDASAWVSNGIGRSAADQAQSHGRIEDFQLGVSVTPEETTQRTGTRTTGEGFPWFQGRCPLHKSICYGFYGFKVPGMKNDATHLLVPSNTHGPGGLLSVVSTESQACKLLVT